jgi:hypothetical protein
LEALCKALTSAYQQIVNLETDDTLHRLVKILLRLAAKLGGTSGNDPNLKPVVDLLKLANPAITDAAVRQVLNTWGPGKFDAEIFLDGKAFNPQQIANGIVTAKNVPGATLIPNARGLAGHNLHTWTGGRGTVTYWNAFVAVLELHGKGTFFDERFDNADQFPIAAKAGLGHISTNPDAAWGTFGFHEFGRSVCA